MGKKNRGLTDQIRASLAVYGPSTLPELSHRLNETEQKIYYQLQQLLRYTGGVERVPGVKPRQYRIYVQQPQQSDVRIAGRVVIRGYRYGWGWRL